MNIFTPKPQRTRAAKRDHSSTVDLARLQENFRAFLALCVSGEKGKRAAQR